MANGLTCWPGAWKRKKTGRERKEVWVRGIWMEDGNREWRFLCHTLFPSESITMGKTGATKQTKWLHLQNQSSSLTIPELAGGHMNCGHSGKEGHIDESNSKILYLPSLFYMLSIMERPRYQRRDFCLPEEPGITPF